MSTEILLIIDKLRKLDSTSLRTPWEWENRVLLEEYYMFNVAIPPEVEREQSYGAGPAGTTSLRRRARARGGNVGLGAGDRSGCDTDHPAAETRAEL